MAAALVAAALFAQGLPLRAAEPSPGVIIADIALQARPGDVLFKSDAGGFWGNMARAFSKTDDRYGHVGVVVGSPSGGHHVIHAGGDPVSREGRVRSDPLRTFLEGVEDAALYRPAADATAASLAYLKAAAGRGAPFDRQFSLETEDRLYCTELVWRALSRAVADDAVPDKSVRAGRVYISLEDLQKSPFLREIAVVSGSAPERPGGQAD